MKYLLTFLLLASCSKTIDTEINNTDRLSWCNDKIAWMGDSLTEAWNEYGNAYSPLYYLAQMMGIDTMAYHTDGTGWHYNNGRGDTSLFMGGISGQTSIQIRDRRLTDTLRQNWAVIIWAGHNNVGNPEVVLKNIDEMVKKSSGRFLVIGLITGNWTDRIKGTEYFSIVHNTINAELKKRYKDQYLEPLDILLANANGSREDSLCVANQVTPASLTIDGLHLKDRGSYLIAKAVFEKVKCKTN